MKKIFLTMLLYTVCLSSFGLGFCEENVNTEDADNFEIEYTGTFPKKSKKITQEENTEQVQTLKEMTQDNIEQAEQVEQVEEMPQETNDTGENSSTTQAEFDTEKYYKKYKRITKDGVVMQALELMNSINISKYSYNALLGNNLTKRPFKIEFKDLSKINPEYATFDALGWQKPDKLNKSKETLYIYINEKHRNAPAEAIAALLAHEAIHQDKFASLNEETYAWTLEAATWLKLTEKKPFVMNTPSSLVERENMLKKLFEKGDYTNKYIKKAVYTNPGYKRLPTRSPGFEDEDL